MSDKPLHANKELILKAFRDVLASEGKERLGPTAISRLTGLHPSLVANHVKGLVQAGLLERLPQGARRALYRLTEVV